ncbi:MAG: hypothetical protein ACK4X1_13100 [Terricaulis sp.]
MTRSLKRRDPMIVARNALPEAFPERHAALRDYFCDKDAAAKAIDDGWELSLSWPGDVERHVDPRLDEGLAWWGDGVKRESMALARRRDGKVLRSLYDSWTLHSWSEWLARQPQPPSHLTILHVDDHEDILSPRLFEANSEWVDPISGKTVSMRDPSSIRSAIESGAVGMGSFMTPFLHALPCCDVRQLRQPPKTRATEDFDVVLTSTPDTLIAPGNPRPSIKLQKRERGVGAGRMRITADMDDWLTDIQDGPVLVHIDMDYFNNRYDGDSDWERNVEPLDATPEEIARVIDKMADALRSRQLIERLEDVVIAFSPGFFPAELWAKADEQLNASLRGLYD